MLSGRVSLEDFVQAVENSSGIERWALWMEITGRLQTAQQTSRHERNLQAEMYSYPSEHRVLPIVGRNVDRTSVVESKARQDELGSLQRDRMLAQSIMKKKKVGTKSTQTIPSDFPFISSFDNGPSHYTNENTREVYPNSNTTKRYDVVTSSESGSSRRTSGRRLQSSQSIASVRRSLGSSLRNGAPGDAPPSSSSAAPTTEDMQEGSKHGLEGRAAAMQLLLQCLGLGRAKLSDLVTHRLKSILKVDVCRLLFVESGRDGPELVQVRTESTAQGPFSSLYYHHTRLS